MMGPKPERRRNYFVKKKFQGFFVLKVVIALLMGLLLSMGVLLYYAGRSLTADYSGGVVNIKPTADALMPYLLTANILAALLVALLGVIIAVVFSHKVAGPLYRFEKSLGVIKQGELTHRVRLRKDDHLKEMEEELNLLAEFFDKRIGAMKSMVEEFSDLINSYSRMGEKEKEEAFEHFQIKMDGLMEHMNMFKTTRRGA